MSYKKENNHTQRKILIAYLGNIFFDTRCFNLFNSLKELGYKVEFVGIEWLSQDFTEIKGDITIYKLKKKSPLFFYLKFCYLILKKALSKKYDYYFAEDVYTLPCLFLAARLFSSKIFYDSREIYASLAGLKNKLFQQKLIAKIEKLFIKRVDKVIVTGEMDAEYLKDFYKLKNIDVLRNLPKFNVAKNKLNLKKNLVVPDSKILLIYQGVILHHRGLKVIFEALQQVDKYYLIILGGGEELEYYKSLSSELGLSNKVNFFGKVDQKELIEYTAAADIGLSIIENASISYYYALPNKLFEYIMAEIPVIISDLPQMKKIVDEYKVGFSINLDKENQLVDLLNYIAKNRDILNEYKENCKQAKIHLNWDNEFKKFKFD